MRLFSKDIQLSFDDIVLVPQPSEINSHKDVDLTMTIGHGDRAIELYLPIIVATTWMNEQSAHDVSMHGGIGIMSRKMSLEDQKHAIYSIAQKNHLVGGSVPGSLDINGYLKNVESLCLAGARVIYIEIPNGHTSHAVELVRQTRHAFPNHHIVAPNVSTWDGFLVMSLAGADSVRVGIGSSAYGHEVPTLSSIMNIYEMQERLELPTSIIAHVTKNTNEDVIKSFAAGADAVVIDQQFFDNGEPVENKLDDIRFNVTNACLYSGVPRLYDLQFASQYAIVSPGVGRK